jgi:hypothetical protein
MYVGKTIFAQIMNFLPKYQFDKCVDKYKGNYKVTKFTCLDQFYCMAFAQLTYRESLRDLITCLSTMKDKLYHMGISCGVARSTLANANELRDWRIYAEFAQVLIREARALYIEDDFGVELDNTVYALDASTIDLCLSVFPWAKFRKTKSAIKLHTLLDLRGPIPAFISITDGKVHDVNILDELLIEPGSIYVMDRGYLDFKRLFNINLNSAYFIIRKKKNTKIKRIYSQKTDKTNGVRYDQIIKLGGIQSSEDYPINLRCVKYHDSNIKKTFEFLTNNYSITSQTVADLYKKRWDVELFFKWIKQHLRIKSFYGTSENAVKTQIWIAVCVYVLIAIIKKKMKIDKSLYTILQILSLTQFEKTSIFQLVTESIPQPDKGEVGIQLDLFDL